MFQEKAESGFYERSLEQCTIDEAKDCLNALAKELTKVKEISRKKQNIFSAVGMQTQEVKHSNFMAWLFDPSNPHELGNDFLCRFLKKLTAYENQWKSKGVNSNCKILEKEGFGVWDEFKSFYNDPKLKVITEKTILGNDRRMDIYIESRAAKTVLVIENKVFTSTHDEQLQAYEDKLKHFGGGWRKILVYLTPKGDIPTDDGKYNPRWCIISYYSILQIMKEMLEAHKIAFRKKRSVRVKLLMEDYIDMVNSEILDNNPELYALCKKIRKDHAKALDILMHYSDNVNDVYEFCAEWIRSTFSDRLEIMRTSEHQCIFITKPIADYFRRKECKIVLENGNYSFCCALSSKDGPIAILAGLETEDGIWSEAQKTIGRAAHPNREIKDRKYHRLFTVPLLTEEERQKKLDEVSETLETHLMEFKTKLEALESDMINAS